MTLFLYTQTVDLLTDNLRHRLLTIATTLAANIVPQEIAALQEEDDWKKPEWRRVTTQLKNVKDRNGDIVYAYIYRKDKQNPAQLQFVADAESGDPYANSDDDPSNNIDANGDGIFDPEGADYLQWPGQEYPEPPDEAFEGPLTSRELYEDAWGKVLTGYEPIIDENGETIAVLAVDVRADDFAAITTQTLFPFVLFVGFLIALVLVLTTLLVFMWNNQLREKNELLSIVSHQLASPLATVRWVLEDVVEGGLGTISDTAAKELNQILRTTKSLTSLVGLLLDVSRIELGKLGLDPQECSLTEFFGDIIPMIEKLAEKKGVKFEISIPAELPQAVIDKRVTRMTIENLLTNAVKYTPKHGTVKLGVEIRDDTLHCTVKDTGIGIPASEQSKIFSKLFRASNVEEIKGNGFGLYVAKGAIQQQGGSLRFTSKEGAGTTFFVDLPITGSASDAADANHGT